MMIMTENQQHMQQQQYMQQQHMQQQQHSQQHSQQQQRMQQQQQHSQQHIKDLSVAEVRKALATIRKNWDDCQQNCRKKPVYLVDSLNIKNLSIQDFAMGFIQRRRACSEKDTEEPTEASEAVASCASSF